MNAESILTIFDSMVSGNALSDTPPEEDEIKIFASAVDELFGTMSDTINKFTDSLGDLESKFNNISYFTMSLISTDDEARKFGSLMKCMYENECDLPVDLKLSKHYNTFLEGYNQH